MERSRRLFNDDLAPAQARTWGVFSLTSVWFSVLHNMGTYAAAAGLLLIGIPAWEAVGAIMLALVLAAIGAQMSGRIGQRWGIPFPVLARASFGVFGANFPALVRALVAVAWYGIQTYLGSRVLIVLGMAFAPQLAAYDNGGAVGLTRLGWAAFMAFWALQLVVMTHGMETIRIFQNYAGAVVSIVMLALAAMIAYEAGGHIDWSFGDAHLPAGAHLLALLGGVAIFFSTFAPLLLTMCDFTRFAPARRDVLWGNVYGLLVNGIVFAVLVAVVTAGSYQLYGRAITEPAELLAATDNRTVIVVGALLFIFATVGVNVIANAVSPAYAFANAFPDHISFTRGAFVTATLSIFMMPWKMFSSPVAINTFLGGIGALLGPFFGVMIADYVLRRGRIDVAALYTEDRDGPYRYRDGLNRDALIAVAPAAVIAIAMTVVPALDALAPYAWFGGAIPAALIYAVRARHADRFATTRLITIPDTAPADGDPLKAPAI